MGCGVRGGEFRHQELYKFLDHVAASLQVHCVALEARRTLFCGLDDGPNPLRSGDLFHIFRNGAESL